VLFDRRNTSDQIISGTLSFSDGTEVAVNPTGGLPNTGLPYVVNLAPAKSIMRVRFSANSVSATTTNVGLTELQVLEVPQAFSNRQPFFTRGPYAGAYGLQPNAKTMLSAPAIDADGDLIVYAWQSQLGTIIGTGPSVTYQASAIQGKDTITVAISDGANAAVAASFVIDIASGNLALK